MIGSLDLVRVHLVSDVHGNAEALARAGDGAEVLVVLGDLLNLVDYHDPAAGVLGRIFGAEKMARFAELRRGRRSGESAQYLRSLWASLHDATDMIEEAICEQYKSLFTAMTAPTYATPGNVDVPAIWPQFAHDGVRILDGETAEIGGLRFGFVGGALLPAGVVIRPRGVWRPYLRSADDFDAAVAGLPEVDVLCSHIPPAVPELTYDVVARRPELGSAALLARIRRDRPRWSLFGHVHQPLAKRMRVEHTECVNVGHFQRTATPYVLNI